MKDFSSPDALTRDSQNEHGGKQTESGHLPDTSGHTASDIASIGLTRDEEEIETAPLADAAIRPKKDTHEESMKTKDHGDGSPRN